MCFSYDHGVLDTSQFRWQCINLGFCFNRDIFISSKGSRLKSLLKEAAWLLTLPTCVLGLTCSLAHLVLHLSWARTHPLYLLFTRWVFFHITPLVFCESYKFLESAKAHMVYRKIGEYLNLCVYWVKYGVAGIGGAYHGC